MLDYSEIFKILKATKLKSIIENNVLQNKIEYVLNVSNFDEYIYWKSLHELLPNIKPTKTDLTKDFLEIGIETDISIDERIILIELLKKYNPWRKGPFNLFGIQIDAEWRSNLKWDRLKNKISLDGKRVLDVGSGNGYYLFKMRSMGAKIALGIDPYFPFIAQFSLFQKYVQDHFVSIFPLSCEDMPDDLNYFDTVFSMGVLYHRISPLEHLQQLFSFLKKGGELVLETLIIDSNNEDVLFPKDRYAKMRNVWFIPSIKMMEIWLTRVGFSNIRCVDISRTTKEEQRNTEWMNFETLDDYLDVDDNSKTIEGYNAPLRGIFLANK